MSDHSPLQPSVVRPDNVPEMVERVARALAAQSFEALGNDKAGAGETAAERRWPHFVPQAYTAIDAMREPTADMVEAGERAIFEDRGAPADWTIQATKDGWDDMIDAALSGSWSGGGERSSSETNTKPLGV